jgi:16S rRNA (uracil1498-N3)-methyltransferase
MVERDDRPPVTTFFAGEPLIAGGTIVLGEGAAHHARVKRLAPGDPVRLTNGAGTLAAGRIAVLRRAEVEVEAEDVSDVRRLSPIHLLVPVADRDRMLWLAEKATELSVTSWQPVHFRRSSSVSPRGEGKAFAAKVRARMVAALEQSGGAWLPEIRAEISFDELPHEDGLLRLVLDAAGAPLLTLVPLGARRDVAVVLGPEGGMEVDELTHLVSVGWRTASLAPTVLRFETAGVAALAALRAASLKEG